VKSRSGDFRENYGNFRETTRFDKLRISSEKLGKSQESSVFRFENLEFLRISERLQIVILLSMELTYIFLAYLSLSEILW
jgi:hypothetical protein